MHDKLKEYINFRNVAFESKLLGGENPLGNLHFCNNQKYLDAYSQDIIYGNKVLSDEGASIHDILYNTVAHRIILNKEFTKNNTDEYGIFRISDYSRLCDNISEHNSWSSRYRPIMFNYHLAKKYNNYFSRGDYFKKIMDDLMPRLDKFVNCNQSEIYHSDIMGSYQIGDFTAYQISSDLLYIDQLNISPDDIDYCSQGTARGFHEITGEWGYSKDVIDRIIELNSMYDHKTEYTKRMIPSDANNVLCEFYKYTISKKTRYRKPEVTKRKEGTKLIIPKSIERYYNESN